MFSFITKKFVDARIRLTREETGATAVEYGLIVGLIAVVIVGAVFALGGTVQGWFEGIDDQLNVVP
jgi:pilus assembly protein Flp/PilA